MHREYKQIDERTIDVKIKWDVGDKPVREYGTYICNDAYNNFDGVICMLEHAIKTMKELKADGVSERVESFNMVIKEDGKAVGMPTEYSVAWKANVIERAIEDGEDERT